MPGDTSYYIVSNNGDTTRLPDSFIRSISATQRPTSDAAEVEGAMKKEEYPPAAGMFFTILIFILVFGGRALSNFIKKQYRVKLAKGAYASNYEWYHQQLNTYNQYYRSLSRYRQEKFVQRTVSFMFNKKFNYINIRPEEQMPLLISAAAVQITFGLNKYQLNYFKNIFIYKEDYQYGLYNRPFMGHVNDDGIHLSWNNFLKGYENYNDADNVGIHEMAHALAYVNFMVGDGVDVEDDFKVRFHHFSELTRPIFNSMQAGSINLLSSYAATNYHEFWAVAVETFFEKPADMKADMPILYYALCTLLNQDPMSTDKLYDEAV
jgi:MtfA peptidase